jgi:hypothetical protein
VAGRRQNANLSCYGEITTVAPRWARRIHLGRAVPEGQRSLQSRCRFGTTKLWWIIGATLQSTARCRPPVVATSFVTIVCASQRLLATTASSTGHTCQRPRLRTLPADVNAVAATSCRWHWCDGSTAARPPKGGKCHGGITHLHSLCALFVYCAHSADLIWRHRGLTFRQ